MGRSCCVPGCGSRYGSKSTRITTYSFPKGNTEKSLELRNKWLKCIDRKNWTPVKNSCVCILHFAEDHLLREDVAPKPDGTLVRLARDRVGLKEGAYPTIFKNRRIVLSPEKPAPCEENKKKRAKVQEEACEPVNDEWLSSDDINSFEDFKKNCRKIVDEEWTPIFFEDYVHIVKYNPQTFRADLCLQVKPDLQFVVYYHSMPLPQKRFPFMTTNKQFLCDRWSKFKTLLAQLKHWKGEECSFELSVKSAVNAVLSCISNLKCQVCEEFCGGACGSDNCENEENVFIWKKLLFIQEQLNLLSLNQPSFSPETLLWAFMLNLQTPSGYCSLRDSHVLTLPHPMYLKKLSVKFSEPNQKSLKTGHVKYLTEKCKTLNKTERLVNVILNKTQVKSQSKYQSEHAEGQSTVCSTGLTTIQTFMLSSIYSKNRDIVGLFPVNNENTDQLLQGIKQVLSVVHQAGYRVLSLISSSYQIDRIAFTHFGIGRLLVKVENPVVPGEYMFTVLDSNHLLKKIRDDWFDQDDEGQTFVLPDFEDFMIKEVASLKVLKDLYHKEASSLVKKDSALSQKVLFPSSTERQNPLYAIQLFDEKTIDALDKVEDARGTKMFLRVVQTWWKVVNVKSSLRGGSLRDNYRSPIDSNTHDSYKFLVKFERWLRAWQNLAHVKPKHKARGEQHYGKLKGETFSALSHCTRAMIKICDELLDAKQHGVSHHVLLGKFQSDIILDCFGLHQLNGPHHYVSVQQILKSPKKPLSLLKLKSATKGVFELTDIESRPLSVEIEVDGLMDAPFQSVVCDADCVDVSTEQIEALIYIAGYAAEEALQSIGCCFCRDFLLDSTRQLSLADLPNNIRDHLRSINRGSIMYPTEFTLNVCLSAFKVFHTLIDRAYEEKFMATLSRRNVLMKLIMKRLYSLDIILDISCECGLGMSTLARKCCSFLVNIFLKNYIKLHDDGSSGRISSERKKRALNAY